jgi:hypothetical protein
MFIPNFLFKTRLQRLVCNVAQIGEFYILHPKRELQKIALAETVSYIQQCMDQATPLDTAREVLDTALRNVRGHQGLYLEFGVYKGATIRYIARQVPNQQVYGFDSFAGLPEVWSGNAETFDSKAKRPRVPGNVQLVEGLFQESLPTWLRVHPEPIAFMHIDCDLYSSTKTVLDLVASRIQPGTVIVFDEYFGYPGWKNHEFKAFSEFINSHRIDYQYLCFARIQCAVRIIQNPSFVPR